MFTNGCRIAVLVACSLALAPTGAHAQAGSVVPAPPPAAEAFLRAEPDEVTRAKFRDVQPEQVAAVRFGGVVTTTFFGFFDNLLPDLQLTDPTLIRQIIQALHEADVYVPTRGRVFFAEPLSIMWVSFKPHDGVTRPLIKLYFNPWSPQDCFGIKFYDAMLALEKYRAGLVRRYVASVAPQVKSLRIYGKGSQHVTGAQDVARLLNALQHVDERSFRLTPCEGDPFVEIDFEFGGGKETDLDFRLYWPSGTDPNLNPPVPQALWGLGCVHRWSEKG